MNNILEIKNCNKCTGCRSCEQICPKNAIKFDDDNEGFLVPIVDINKCVECGLCLKKCHQKIDNLKENKQQFYAGYLNDNEAIKKSASGGVFYALSTSILNENGVVYGCAYIENLEVKHIRIDCIDDLPKLQGTKYVQSDTSSTYLNVKNDLENDLVVLYSGTPCQIAGLISFLGKDFEKLFTVDIICHGVPSPKLFKKYLEYLSIKNRSNVVEYNFRTKKNGWGLQFEYITESKNDVCNSCWFDPYYSAFIKEKTYRECCYQCKYAQKNRIGDITIGDYWGIRDLHPDIFNFNGNSLIIINTSKGKKMFFDISKQIKYLKSDFQKASFENVNLIRPSTRPHIRNWIYKGLDKNLIFFFKIKMFAGINLKQNIKRIMNKELYNNLKNILKH